MWWNSRQSAGSRAGSRTSRGSRASTRGSQPRELEFQFFIRQTETLYPPWWTREGVISWYRDLPDDTYWNSYICGCVLLAVIWTVSEFENIYLDILDVVYNVSYAIHVFAIGYKIVTELENTDITFWTVLGFLVDLGSFAHYVQTNRPGFKLACYYARLHRPYKYLGSLNDYNLKGSILGTTLKYCYIFMIVRITSAYIWLHLDKIATSYYPATRRAMGMKGNMLTTSESDTPAFKFLTAFYQINKMFLPIGPPTHPANDAERVTGLMIMVVGCLVLSGAAVASLTIIISLYMSPEETFRARYRLIMEEMTDSQVPPALREKVMTFYMMYWHKQRAVSQTRLLPVFPPTLPATVRADIYFEATQKARILRELSYQLLSEIAKSMETIHYIPGDALIKRGSKRSSIIYITYGDIEMLTAEDDSTAILRLTRGTVLTPCAGAVALAVSHSHVAVRAATFCTAHVLPAAELWRIVHKHSVSQDHAGPILASFTDHIERVKRHYLMKIPDEAFHKSSILNFNRNLLALKEMKNTQGEPLLASSDVFLEVAGCYIMRNRPDTTLIDQSDDICLRPTFPCILQPTSSLLFAWQMFVAALILAVCIAHPYYLVFKQVVPLEFRFFDYVTTFVFVIDNIVHLSTGANVEEGVPITFTQTSSQQMRSSWFVLDVVGTLPLFEFIGDGHYGGINKLLRLPKLFRVLKSLEETCVYRGNVLRFLSYTLLLLIACYIIAALQQEYMCSQAGYCRVTNFTHPPFWDKLPKDEETVSHRLAFCLYWAICMVNFVIHRETWANKNSKNMIYTMCILEVCVVLRLFIEAVYASTIMVTTALSEDYGSRIATVKNFLVRNKVDPQLRKRFITYLELCWHTDKAYKMTHRKHSTIFYDLPPHVFQDIVGRNRSKYILCIPFMRLIKKEDLRIVSSHANLFYTSPNEILLNTGELTNEMYIIKQGICEILDPTTQKRIGQLSTKNHFGALICLLRLPAYYTIRAVTHVQVFCIARKYMLKAMENPQIKSALDSLKSQPEYIRLQTGFPSFVKYEPLPPTPNTMHFKLPRKHEPDSEFLHPFDTLGFLSILRYVFPRFTIRPDGRYMVRYEWFRVTCAMFSTMLFPFYTYLVLQWPILYYVAMFLDLSAWYDIFQRMLVGYFNNDGILIYHPSSTAAYYMKGPFIMDLFGCLALENLEASRKDSLGDRFRVTPTKQFLMLNRLIQLYRLPSAMLVLEEYIERRDILMVFQAIPLFIALINIMTCFMIFYSVNIYYSIDKNGKYEWLIEPFKDKGGSWVNLFHDSFRFNLTHTPWNLHLATYFWVVYESSTTGYGELNPSNIDIMHILFIGMVTGMMMVTYFSVRIISVRANVNKSLAGFQQHLKDINAFMAKEKLDGELQKEMRRYYEYNWEKMGGIDYRGVLKLCDQITLRTDAILHIYGPTFNQCPLLSEKDVSLVRIIGRAVRSVYFLREMKIIEHDDLVTNIYFVDYGGVEVRVSTGEMSSVIRLPRGSVFGNLEGTEGKRSPYNVVATSRLHLLMIKSQVFDSIMKDFPSIKVLMDKYRGPEKKLYVLGSDAQVKLRRNVSTPPPRSKRSIIKYIYFEEGVVQLYLIVVCLGCIYLDLYNAGYQINESWLLITLYSLDVGFLAKILMQHALPLLVMNKNLKKIMLPLRKMYFKREFKYDMASVIPIEVLSFASKDNSWMWFPWLRLNRMIRITTIYKMLKRRSENTNVNLAFDTILSLSIWFSLYIHTSTCLWYYIGVIEDHKKPNSSWRFAYDGHSHCDNTYVCSMYFMVTTFTQNGVGDIMPQKRSEVVFIALMQIISTLVFMVYVGEFSNIIQYQSYRSFSFYSKYLELQDFMKNNRVSKNLVTIVNKYTLHFWRETRGLQVPHFLTVAPMSLRLRVMSATYLHHITRHHIFEECEPAFLRQMVGCLKLYTYNEDMYVVKESEITDAMYIIHTGKVKETCEDMDISARVYPAGSYFGILQGLLRNTPYTHSYQTMIKSQVLTLKLDDWEYLLKHFPNSRDSIHKHMSQLGDKDMDRSNWPGGKPEPPKAPEHEPLSEIVETLPPGNIEGLYPTGRFGRRRSSDDEDAPVLPAALRRQSAFAWPTDNRDNDDEPDMASTARRITEMRDRGEQQEEATEVHAKVGFFKKLAATAKKLMGRVSDPDALAGAGGKDDLLLEEDEEATEALILQLEEAQQAAKDKEAKKFKPRRKSMFHSALDDDTEKHMLTLDITDSQTDQVQQTESEPFAMRPLRIRESEEEPREMIQLGRPRAKTLEPKEEEEEEIVDLESAANTSFTRRPILFDPGAAASSGAGAGPPPTPFKKSKNVFPGFDPDTGTVLATPDAQAGPTTEDTATTRDAQDTQSLQDASDTEASKLTSFKKPTDIFPGPEADQDTETDRATPDTQTDWGAPDTSADRDAQDTPADRDTEPTQDASDTEAQPSPFNEDTTDTKAARDTSDKDSEPENVASMTLFKVPSTPGEENKLTETFSDTDKTDSTPGTTTTTSRYGDTDPVSETTSPLNFDRSESAAMLAKLHGRDMTSDTDTGKTSEIYTKEESTSASKLNRHFIQVRYDEKEDEGEGSGPGADAESEHQRTTTTDSEETADKGVGKSDDEDASESPSEGAAEGSEPKKKKKKKKLEPESE